MKFEIKSRFSASVLFSLETESLKLCVQAAVEKSADLSGADLSGADLRGADLSGAALSGADLSGADLRGAYLSGADLSGAKIRTPDGDALLVRTRPYFQLGPLGSRNDYLVAYLTDKGVYVKAGCFFNALKEFVAAVEETHGTDSVEAEEYGMAIKMIKLHAKHFTPAKETEVVS